MLLSYRTGAGVSGKEFTSPVETSLRFNLPTQVTLPDGIQHSTFQFNKDNVNNTPNGNYYFGWNGDYITKWLKADDDICCSCYFAFQLLSLFSIK